MKIDPRTVEGKVDYKRLIDYFGLEKITEDIVSILPKSDLNYLFTRRIVFAHRDFDKIIEKLESGEFAIVTGIMPSAERVHFGTKLVVDVVRFFQQFTDNVFITIADIEADATRGVPLKEARRRAIENYVPARLALGLDPKRTKFYFQSRSVPVLQLSHMYGYMTTVNEIEAIYGNYTPGRLIAAVTQAGDVTRPSVLYDLQVLVPVGADQDPHIRFARDLVRRARKHVPKLKPPVSVYFEFTPGIDGSPKMSKSKPSSCIRLPEDDYDSLRKRLRRAASGGRKTKEEQRKLGGIPSECAIFSLFRQHLITSDEELERIKEECLSGKRLCSECKRLAFEKLKEFMEEFKRKFEEYKEYAKKLDYSIEEFVL